MPDPEGNELPTSADCVGQVFCLEVMRPTILNTNAVLMGVLN